MSDPQASAGAAPAAGPASAQGPARRGCRGGCFLLGLALALVAAVGLVIALSPSLQWSARATFSPASNDEAWRLLPAGRPIIAALDVKDLLESPVAHEIRPEIERAAASQGFDLGLTEDNARLLLLASDGRGFAAGAATGPRLSPLLLPRFDARWRPHVAAGGAAVTDGSAIIRPMSPGLVAYAVSESGQDATLALEAALSQAAHASQPPESLEGATLLVLVVPDDTLHRRMVASVPREAALHARNLVRLEARATAGESLDAVLRLTMRSEDSAAILTGALQQLDQVLTTGLIAFLAPFLGESARIVAKIPPFDVSREGGVVVVTMSATAEHLRALLAEIPGG